MLEALGHAIKSAPVRKAMRALGAKAPETSDYDLDYENNVLEAPARGPRGELTFRGYARYVGEYGEPLSRVTHDADELLLITIDFSKRSALLPYGLRLGDSQAIVVEKLGKKPRAKSTTDYGTAWWFYVDGYRLIAAFNRKRRLMFLRAFVLDLSEKKRAATAKKTYVLKVPPVPKKRPTTAWTKRMKGGDTAFTAAGIAKADALLDTFIASVAALAKAQKSAGLLPATKKLVLALNKLNRTGMIETMEREELCAFIESALRATGFDPGPDPTEPWREW